MNKKISKRKRKLCVRKFTTAKRRVRKPAKMVPFDVQSYVQTLTNLLARGVPLTVPQLTRLEVYRRESAALHTPQAGPKDVWASCHRDAYEMLAVHRNVYLDWRNRGYLPAGMPPYSMREICWHLAKARKLRQVAPAHQGVAAIRAWVLGVGLTQWKAPSTVQFTPTTDAAG